MITASLEELIPIIQEVLEQGGAFPLTVSGDSMFPTLRHLRDQVELVSPQQRQPRVGDILLFQRVSGEYILHRYIGHKNGRLLINGDAQVWTETIHAGQIIGVVRSIEHNGRWVSCDHTGYRIGTMLWRLARPLRLHLFRMAAWLKKVLKR